VSIAIAFFIKTRSMRCADAFSTRNWELTMNEHKVSTHEGGCSQNRFQQLVFILHWIRLEWMVLKLS
jgi:hypothetical protein